MSTNTRPELSKRNKYYISKHRYYELKHFCLQYKEWKQLYNEICNYCPGGIMLNPGEKYHLVDIKPFIEKRQKYLDMIDLVEESTKIADENLSRYLLKAVTEDRSYDYLRTVMRIPCCKDSYYELYRRFFWILSNKKNA